MRLKALTDETPPFPIYSSVVWHSTFTITHVRWRATGFAQQYPRSQENAVSSRRRSIPEHFVRRRQQELSSRAAMTRSLCVGMSVSRCRGRRTISLAMSNLYTCRAPARPCWPNWVPPLSSIAPDGLAAHGRNSQRSTTVVNTPEGGQRTCHDKSSSRRRIGAIVDQYRAVLGSCPGTYYWGSWSAQFTEAGVTLLKEATRHGQTLQAALPEEVAQQRVRHAALEAPALCGLLVGCAVTVPRSLPAETCRTLPTSLGTEGARSELEPRPANVSWRCEAPQAKLGTSHYLAACPGAKAGARTVLEEVERLTVTSSRPSFQDRLHKVNQRELSKSTSYFSHAADFVPDAVRVLVAVCLAPHGNIPLLQTRSISLCLVANSRTKEPSSAESGIPSPNSLS